MDDLHVAMTSAFNGMAVQQRNAAIASRNIEHADDDKYTRLIADVSNDLDGYTRISQVRRVIDEYIETMRIDKTSDASYAHVKSAYLSRVHDLFGKPGGLDELKVDSVAVSLRESVDDFFTKMQELANNPENYTLKEFVVSKAEDLSHMIRDISGKLHGMRVQAEEDFDQGVDLVNHNLRKLYALNQHICNTTNKDELLADLQNKRDEVLLKIAEYIDVSAHELDNGKVFVTSTRGGRALVDDFLCELKYHSIPKSVEEYEDLFIRYADKDPTDTEGDVVVQFNRMKAGKLKALKELRDFDLPAAIDQIDNFAHLLSKHVNEVYSSGASYPGIPAVQSDKAIARIDRLDFEGSIRIAVLDKRGAAVEWADGDPIRPLTVEIDDKSVGEILDEINGYYNLNPNRVQFDSGLQDLQLKKLANNGQGFSFGLVADNPGLEDHFVKIKEVKVFAYNSPPGLEPQKLYLSQRNLVDYSETMKVEPGEVKHYNDGFDLDISRLPTGADGFVVELAVEVDGIHAIIEYSVINPENRRFYANSVSSDAAHLVERTGNQQYIKAELVNAKGAEVNGRYQPGFISLSVLDHSKHSLVLDAFDSSKRFVDEKVNFVHDLGFNNLFNETEEVSDSALKFAVDKDLLRDNARLNVARLISHKGSNICDIGLGNGEVALDIFRIANEHMFFPPNAYLPGLNSTFSLYTTEMGEHAAFKAYEANMRADNELAFQKVLEGSHYAVSGVNIDEELGKMVMVENYYLACNKSLVTIRELMDEFLKSF